jgi:hypothetical protein
VLEGWSDDADWRVCTCSVDERGVRKFNVFER